MIKDDSFQLMLRRPGVIPRLHALSLKVFGRELRDTQVDDIVQGALLSAWENRASFRGRTETEFFGWFLSIVRNRAIDEVRRRQLAPLLLGDQIVLEALDVPADEQARLSDEPEARSALERGLAKLGKVERAVIELIFRYSLPIAEVGPLLGMELSAVRMAQLRAVRKLRRFVAPRVSC